MGASRVSIILITRREFDLIESNAPEVETITQEHFEQHSCETAEVIERLTHDDVRVCIGPRGAITVHTSSEYHKIVYSRDYIIVKDGNCYFIAYDKTGSFTLLAWDGVAARTGYLKAVARTKKAILHGREYTVAELRLLIRDTIKRTLGATGSIL
jgi:hypothetical protein